MQLVRTPTEAVAEAVGHCNDRAASEIDAIPVEEEEAPEHASSAERKGISATVRPHVRCELS